MCVSAIMCRKSDPWALEHAHAFHQLVVHVCVCEHARRDWHALLAQRKRIAAIVKRAHTHGNAVRSKLLAFDERMLEELGMWLGRE